MAIEDFEKFFARGQQDRLHAVPTHRSTSPPPGTHPRLQQRRFPRVGQNHGMEEPQATLRIHMERRIAVRESSCVPEGETGFPRTRSGPTTRGLKLHIIGLTLAGPIEPRHQQRAVGSLDHTGGMIVPGLRSKDRLGDQRGYYAVGTQNRQSGQAPDPPANPPANAPTGSLKAHDCQRFTQTPQTHR